MDLEPFAYTIVVDENSHYMDAYERYEHAVFDICEEAIAACQKIVDTYLLANYKPHMTAEELYESYTLFGEDPFIATAETAEECRFSAWDYARQRCEALCSPQRKEPQ